MLWAAFGDFIIGDLAALQSGRSIGGSRLYPGN